MRLLMINTKQLKDSLSTIKKLSTKLEEELGVFPYNS